MSFLSDSRPSSPPQVQFKEPYPPNASPNKSSVPSSGSAPSPSYSSDPSIHTTEQVSFRTVISPAFSTPPQRPSTTRFGASYSAPYNSNVFSSPSSTSSSAYTGDASYLSIPALSSQLRTVNSSGDANTLSLRQSTRSRPAHQVNLAKHFTLPAPLFPTTNPPALTQAASAPPAANAPAHFARTQLSPNSSMFLTLPTSEDPLRPPQPSPCAVVSSPTPSESDEPLRSSCFVTDNHNYTYTTRSPRLPHASFASSADPARDQSNTSPQGSPCDTAAEFTSPDFTPTLHASPHTPPHTPVPQRARSSLPSPAPSPAPANEAVPAPASRSYYRPSPSRSPSQSARDRRRHAQTMDFSAARAVAPSRSPARPRAGSVVEHGSTPAHTFPTHMLQQLAAHAHGVYDTPQNYTPFSEASSPSSPSSPLSLTSPPLGHSNTAVSTPPLRHSNTAISTPGASAAGTPGPDAADDTPGHNTARNTLGFAFADSTRDPISATDTTNPISAPLFEPVSPPTPPRAPYTDYSSSHLHPSPDPTDHAAAPSDTSPAHAAPSHASPDRSPSRAVARRASAIVLSSRHPARPVALPSALTPVLHRRRVTAPPAALARMHALAMQGTAEPLDEGAGVSVGNAYGAATNSIDGDDGEYSCAPSNTQFDSLDAIQPLAHGTRPSSRSASSPTRPHSLHAQPSEQPLLSALAPMARGDSLARSTWALSARRAPEPLEPFLPTVAAPTLSPVREVASPANITSSSGVRASPPGPFRRVFSFGPSPSPSPASPPSAASTALSTTAPTAPATTTTSVAAPTAPVSAAVESPHPPPSLPLLQPALSLTAEATMLLPSPGASLGVAAVSPAHSLPPMPRPTVSGAPHRADMPSSASTSSFGGSSAPSTPMVAAASASSSPLPTASSSPALQNPASAATCTSTSLSIATLPTMTTTASAAPPHASVTTTVPSVTTAIDSDIATTTTAVPSSSSASSPASLFAPSARPTPTASRMRSIPATTPPAPPSRSLPSPPDTPNAPNTPATPATVSTTTLRAVPLTPFTPLSFRATSTSAIPAPQTVRPSAASASDTVSPASSSHTHTSTQQPPSASATAVSSPAFPRPAYLHTEPPRSPGSLSARVADLTDTDVTPERNVNTSTASVISTAITTTTSSPSAVLRSLLGSLDPDDALALGGVRDPAMDEIFLSTGPSPAPQRCAIDTLPAEQRYRAVHSPAFARVCLADGSPAQLASDTLREQLGLTDTIASQQDGVLSDEVASGCPLPRADIPGQPAVSLAPLPPPSPPSTTRGDKDTASASRMPWMRSVGADEARGRVWVVADDEIEDAGPLSSSYASRHSSQAGGSDVFSPPSSVSFVSPKTSTTSTTSITPTTASTASELQRRHSGVANAAILAANDPHSLVSLGHAGVLSGELWAAQEAAIARETEVNLIRSEYEELRALLAATERQCNLLEAENVQLKQKQQGLGTQLNSSVQLVSTYARTVRDASSSARASLTREQFTSQELSLFDTITATESPTPPRAAALLSACVQLLVRVAEDRDGLRVQLCHARTEAAQAQDALDEYQRFHLERATQSRRRLRETLEQRLVRIKEQQSCRAVWSAWRSAFQQRRQQARVVAFARASHDKLVTLRALQHWRNATGSAQIKAQRADVAAAEAATRRQAAALAAWRDAARDRAQMCGDKCKTERMTLMQENDKLATALADTRALVQQLAAATRTVSSGVQTDTEEPLPATDALLAAHAELRQLHALERLRIALQEHCDRCGAHHCICGKAPTCSCCADVCRCKSRPEGHHDGHTQVKYESHADGRYEAHSDASNVNHARNFSAANADATQPTTAHAPASGSGPADSGGGAATITSQHAARQASVAASTVPLSNPHCALHKPVAFQQHHQDLHPSPPSPPSPAEEENARLRALLRATQTDLTEAKALLTAHVTIAHARATADPYLDAEHVPGYGAVERLRAREARQRARDTRRPGPPRSAHATAQMPMTSAPRSTHQGNSSQRIVSSLDARDHPRSQIQNQSLDHPRDLAREQAHPRRRVSAFVSDDEDDDHVFHRTTGSESDGEEEYLSPPHPLYPSPLRSAALNRAATATFRPNLILDPEYTGDVGPVMLLHERPHAQPPAPLANHAQPHTFTGLPTFAAVTDDQYRRELVSNRVAGTIGPANTAPSALGGTAVGRDISQYPLSARDTSGMSLAEHEARAQQPTQSATAPEPPSPPPEYITVSGRRYPNQLDYRPPAATHTTAEDFDYLTQTPLPHNTHAARLGYDATRSTIEALAPSLTHAIADEYGDNDGYGLPYDQEAAPRLEYSSAETVPRIGSEGTPQLDWAAEQPPALRPPSPCGDASLPPVLDSDTSSAITLVTPASPAASTSQPIPRIPHLPIPRVLASPTTSLQASHLPALPTPTTPALDAPSLVLALPAPATTNMATNTAIVAVATNEAHASARGARAALEQASLRRPSTASAGMSTTSPALTQRSVAQNHPIHPAASSPAYAAPPPALRVAPLTTVSGSSASSGSPSISAAPSPYAGPRTGSYDHSAAMFASPPVRTKTQAQLSLTTAVFANTLPRAGARGQLSVAASPLSELPLQRPLSTAPTVEPLFTSPAGRRASHQQYFSMSLPNTPIPALAEHDHQGHQYGHSVAASVAPERSRGVAAREMRRQSAFDISVSPRRRATQQY